MSGLASWCFRHRFIVLAIWLAAAVGLGIATAAVGNAYSNSFSLPNTESTRALQLLKSTFPNQAGETDTVVWHVGSGSVKDPAVKNDVSAMLTKLAQAPQVNTVTSPYTAAGAKQISDDGKTAYATFTFNGVGSEISLDTVNNVTAIAKSAERPGLEIALGGAAIQGQNRVSTSVSEIVGLLAAAIILFLAFGSLLSMLMPLAIAILSLATGEMTIGLLSHAFTLPSIAPTVAALIGLGVGIDYALFIVTRHRNGIKAGLDPHEAVQRALNTSGRAVIFAGGTVCVAMLGLLILGVGFLNGIGIASAIMVVFTVLAAMTLLPALLGIIGGRVLSRKERRVLAAEGAHDVHASGFWARWSAKVQRRPWTFSIVALLLIAIMSIPTLSLRLGSSDQGNDPVGTTTRAAYDLLAEGFGPGSNGPLQLVAKVNTPEDAKAMANLEQELRTTPGVAEVQVAPLPPMARFAIVTVTPTTSPQDQATTELIRTIRSELIPDAQINGSPQVYVGGQTAVYEDFAEVLTAKLPLFIGVIIGLGFLLLLVAFRSVVIPLTAAVMNLLAAAASFGVVVAFFQWGWGSEAMGLGSSGPIEVFLPVMMLAILFGLSMDYQVFLVSRMYEEWIHTHDNARAVTVGQAATGRVITAAATIMIFVFLAFVFGGQRVIAEFGVGLSVAVFIDAFILRTLLVPALMHMFGNSNWWLPGWIDRSLPHLSVEPPDEETQEQVDDVLVAASSR